jgi:hypothetical protein
MMKYQGNGYSSGNQIASRHFVVVFGTGMFICKESWAPAIPAPRINIKKAICFIIKSTLIRRL